MQVMKSTVSAAGRANRTVNAVIDGLGRISKGTMVIAAAISIYQVTVADDWKYEAGNQVSSWAGAIAGGYTGAAVGSILGPPGAIIGGIAGSIIGSLATEGAYSDLANWFFGGKSDSNGKAILGTGYDDALKHAKECIRKPGRNYHVHVVLQSHLSIIRSGNQSEIAAAVEEMVYTASLPKMDETNDDVGNMFLEAQLYCVSTDLPPGDCNTGLDCSRRRVPLSQRRQSRGLRGVNGLGL